MLSDTSSIIYHDKWLRVIAYPLLAFYICQFGNVDPLYEQLKTSIYYMNVGWNLVIVSIVWETNRFIIKYLDRSFPWHLKTTKRLLLQAFSVLPVSFVQITALIYIYNGLLIDRPENFNIGNLMVLDLPLTMVFVVLVNLIYTGMYFYQHHLLLVANLQAEITHLQRQLDERQDLQSMGISMFADAATVKKLVVNYGASSIPIDMEAIAYIYKQQDICYIKTFQNKVYASTSSLESLEELLDTLVFFRVNRQMIANIRSISRFKSDATGKLLLELEPSFAEEVSVSKKKAPEFREWIGQKV